MKKISSILFFVFIIMVKGTFAQITIAPTMLFIDQQNRFGTLLVLNGSDQNQEISISFPFGYPVTDSNGDIQMVYDDSTRANEYGIDDLVRGFPQNFVLAPGQRQVVRLTIRPKQFQDGTYWTRIKTTSNPQSATIGEASSDEITAQITYKLDQVTTLFYKHGEVETGINIENFSTRQTEDHIQFIADAERTGNSPFLGSIVLEIKDTSGNTVAEKLVSTSIFFDYRQVFEIPKGDLEGGSYSASITFRSQRSDVPSEQIVQMDPVTKSISFTEE